MAGSQPGLSTPNGNIVSFDDINAILQSVDSGQPFQISVKTISVGNDQKQSQLQIRNSTEVNNKHVNEPYDSRAMVEQLQSLQVGDGSILEQILTSSRPAALSELNAAHDKKSMIHLVTAKDGRVFSILAGLPADGNWNGENAIQFLQGPTRKLSDHTLAAEKITAYQSDALKNVLAAVMTTEDSREFQEPVQVLQPKLWNNYKKLIAEPIDLGTMKHMLDHNRYATMADFRRHVDLLEQNARRYNGDRISITTAAMNVRSDIYRRMNEIPAEPSLRGESVSQVRLCSSIHHGGSVSAAIPDNDGANDTDSDEHQHASDGESVGSEDSGDIGGMFYVLPLGRLCVARPAGGDEAIHTPYLVVMTLDAKRLWLVKDTYTPIRLPEDKKTLLDFGVRYNFALGSLGVIDDWKVRRGTQVPTLSWAMVEKNIRRRFSCETEFFYLVKNQEEIQDAAQIIETGRYFSSAWPEEDEDSSNEDSQGNN